MNINTDALRAQLAEIDGTGAGSYGVDPYLVQKIAHDAARAAIAEREYAEKVSMVKLSRAQQIDSLLDEMATAHTVAFLKQSGVDVDEVFGIEGLSDIADDLLHEAAQYKIAISEALVEGEDAAEDLAEMTLEEAMEDPEVAAALISEATGEDIAPEDIEALAAELAEGSALDDEGYEKEAHVKLSSVGSILEGLSTQAQYVIGLRAGAILRDAGY